MPTYVYACTDCGHTFETVQSFSDDALTTCPSCAGKLRKVFNSVGIVFKGSGFYRNDSRTGGKQESPASSSSSPDSKDAKDSKADSSSSSSSDSKSSSADGKPSSSKPSSSKPSSSKPSGSKPSSPAASASSSAGSPA